MCVSVVRENTPGLHTASLLGVPATFTVVSTQGLCMAHSVLRPSSVLNVPLAQGSHFAAFPFLKLKGTNFLPAAHFVTDTRIMHGLRVVVVVKLIVQTRARV